MKEYSQNNKEKINYYQKEYRENNKDKIINKMKEYYLDNREKLKNQSKKYSQNNKDKINLRINKRKKEDLQFRISHNLRTRLYHALKNDQKVGSAIRDLGCSIDDLKIWLEDHFQDGMNWDNYGNKEGQWSIDHIIPLSKVDLINKEDLLKVCNYTNLQPLWHLDNLKKGNK